MESINNIFASVNNADKNLKNIEKQMFEVVKLSLIPEGGLSIFKPSDKFGLYRSNGGNCLGTVGSQFVPMQPSEFLTNIVETVRDFGANLDLSTLKFKEFCGGSKIEFSIKMHPISFKNNKGLQDITNLELTFSTAFDGSKSNTISLYTERLVCTNGMVANKLEGVLKGRNTISGKAKILSYQKEVAELIEQTENFKQKMIALDKIKVSKQQIEEFKLKLLGYNKETLLKAENEAKKAKGDKAKPETRKFNILDKIDTAINIEFERTGQTAFGLLQGITYYTNHIANGSNEITNQEYIRFNQGFKTNSKAQELLFELIEA